MRNTSKRCPSVLVRLLNCMVKTMMMEEGVALATFTWGEDTWTDTFIVSDLLQLQLFADYFGGSLDYYEVIDLPFADASHNLWCY